MVVEAKETKMTEITQLTPKEVFEFLKGHTFFSHVDDKSNERVTSYYFRAVNDMGFLLFIDISNDWDGTVYTDETFAMGRAQWFDDLYKVVTNLYDINRDFDRCSKESPWEWYESQKQLKKEKL